MAYRAKNKSRKKKSRLRVPMLVALFIIVGAVIGTAIYYLSQKNTGISGKSDGYRDKPVVPASPVLKPPGVISSAVSQPKNIGQRNNPLKKSSPDTVKSGLAGNESARLAIIVDDMGSSLSEAKSLAAINVPLTFSIIPGLRADKDVAAFAGLHNIETIIHIPMQSKEWPTRRIEANGLLINMDADELQKRISGFIALLPRAVGANNHMGSAFTEHEDKMAIVLEALKMNNLFFIDSVTTPDSVGEKVAQRLGMRFARRNVFLDNEQNRGYILGQLNRAVRLAQKHGTAIAICHPHPSTIATLESALPELAAQGVHLVTASQLVK